ncbi:aspartate dehydrogenase [Thalassorhabdomicrobium marinisediminis]|uniref:L-aspartate dehydrogenase n=1 Tax=Thalassorhabdomicrobium marinisediminis TaxID=2170577 RepID=A0A2T7FTI1_9RHOB|nr:aspartate dehydrogenase [Thalassorhabdomicrobium marinisediminis]PVA05463.1 aspartate dehydrogenase [Thalassorhabdomicrobium marinisediminis]
MKIGLIGGGAIGRYVAERLTAQGDGPHALLVRPGRLDEASGDGIDRFGSVADLPSDIDLMVDCAGHGALIEHGAAILERGIDLITVSLGALADPQLEAQLTHAAEAGGAQLHLASGAIGALDALQAARVGGLTDVTYTGRKPPNGWRGSPAEDHLDLDALNEAATHFEGTARQAATDYPKNANVAAAVALAGIGFDATQVRLIADPQVTANIHEVTAKGTFGQFTFHIEGTALPDNPRSSALAAMSVIAAIRRRRAAITT